MKNNSIFKVCYEYRMAKEWISGHENVLADCAESAIKKAKKEALAFTWDDIPDSGKNKGKEVEYKCTGFRLESVELLALATL